MSPHGGPRLRHVLAWLLVVIVTATITTLLVGRLGEDVAGELTTQPAVLGDISTTAPTPSPASAAGASETRNEKPSPAPTSQGLGAAQTFSTAGGAVVAACRGDAPYAKSVTPRSGYAFETESEQHVLTVTFSGAGGEYTLRVRCQAGKPEVTQSAGPGD